MDTTRKNLSGSRILIVAGKFAGQEGICLGVSAEENKWAVSPDNSNEVLNLVFENEFGLLLDISGDVQNN
jgi:hypothetical protein